MSEPTVPGVFGQVDYLRDHAASRRASHDPMAMVGFSKVQVASGSFDRNRCVIVTHKEGGGMEVLVSDIRSARSVSIVSSAGETRAALIARGHAAFDGRYGEP